jgi:hypothetical protein
MAFQTNLLQRNYLEKPFFPLTQGKLDTSAGWPAVRRRREIRTAGNSLGTDAACGHQFLNIRARALRAFGDRIIGGQHQLFKTMTAGLALVFVNRHFDSLKIFPKK